ncbi:MAG: hypothetical protein ACLTLQ_21920 [[Clostridium] scindens]
METDSCFCIKGWKLVRCPGLVPQQEAAELTEEQFNYLMLGLNPLDPKIKEIHPKQAQ